MQYKDALEKAKNEFASKDPYFIAEQSGGKYIQAEKVIEISYLNKTTYIKHPEADVLSYAGIPDINHEEEVCIIQYLTKAICFPQIDRWRSFIELPGGCHHLAPFQKEAITPLAKKYGQNSKLFYERAEKYGAIKTEMGDISVKLQVFPRLSLAFIVWLADEEFPASANILFDSYSELYLSTATLYVLAIMVTKRVFAI